MRPLLALLLVTLSACTVVQTNDGRSDDKCVIVPRPPSGQPRLTLSVGESTSDTQNFVLQPFDVEGLVVRGSSDPSDPFIAGEDYALRLVQSGDTVNVTITHDETTFFTDTVTGVAHDRDSARPMPHVYPERAADEVSFDFVQYRYSLTFYVTD